MPVMLRQLSGAIDGWTANGVRYPLAALIYWPLIWMGVRRGQVGPALLARCLLPALLALGGQMLWGLAPYYLPAGVIAFYIRLTLVWSLIASILLFHDDRRLLGVPTFYLGLLLTGGGFLWLSQYQPAADSATTARGMVIIVTCSLFFGLYGVSVRYFLRDVPPLIGFGLVAQIVSLGTFPAMLYLGDWRQLGDLSALNTILLISSSLLGVALGHALLYTAVQQLGAAIASGVQTIGPFLTVLLASLTLGEQLTGGQFLAGTLTVAGAGTLLFSRYRASR